MQFTLEQFGDVLRVRNIAGKPFVIIGGQAVNYWATRYLSQEPTLSVWRPFTSKDIDFRGNRDHVLRMAAQLQCPAVFPHKKMMTAFAGGGVWSIGGSLSRVEFIRHVPSVTAGEIEKLAVEHDYIGQRIRVIDPISLLFCKLDLTLTVDQTNRRDEDHFRILLFCARAFLREVLLGAEAGEFPMRGWLGATERLIKIAESSLGRKAAMKLEVQWDQFLPEAEIKASKNPLIVGFREKRLPQWLKKIQRPQRSKRT